MDGWIDGESVWSEDRQIDRHGRSYQRMRVVNVYMNFDEFPKLGGLNNETLSTIHAEVDKRTFNT